MDFLNKSLAQLGDLFRSMTPGARITAGLLLIVVVVSLAYLFNHQISGAETYLLGGHAFSANEMPTVESALASAGLKDFRWDGNRMQVPRHQQPAYVAALAEGKALPVNWGDYLSRALDSGSPFTTDKERERRLNIARQQELGQVLRCMKGVVNAMVQYDTKKQPGFGMKQLSTASVALQLAGGQQLDSESVKKIRWLVAGTFVGMSPEQVIVADINGGAHTAVGPDGIGGGDDHQYLAASRAFRQFYEEQIKNALSYVQGVTVVAHVELTKELGSKSNSTRYDPKVVTEMVREKTDTEKMEAAQKGGPPGLSSQQQANSPAKIVDGGKGSTSEKDSSTREEHNRVSQESTQVQTIGMVPDRVTVSIGVPSTYFEQVWRRQNPTPTGQTPKPPDPAALAQIEADEVAKIKGAAAHLLPKKDLIDPTPLVNVARFTHAAPTEIPGPGIGTQSLTWLGEYWRTLGMILLGLVSLAMLRSMIRAAPPATRAIELPLLSMNEESEAETAAAEAAAKEPPRNRLRRKASSGESLRDDLVEMVREDPDAAAAILRSWIGTAT